MNLLRKEEKDKLGYRELLLVLLLTISKRKELKNQKSEKLWFNKQKEKSRKENKRLLILKELTSFKNLRMPKFLRSRNNQKLLKPMPEDDLSKI